MGRNGIKIIEFDQDDTLPQAERSGSAKGMKIVEFDDDVRDQAKVVATAKDIGHIKIVEFDDAPPVKRSSATNTPKTFIKPIKIRDFGTESEAKSKMQSGSSAEQKIKIMEFDW